MEHVDEILLSREIWLDQERRENLEITIREDGKIFVQWSEKNLS